MSTRFDRDAVARASERAGEPAWLAERRAVAFERFESLPWPDPALEEWRHTDVRRLDLDAFDPFPIAPERDPDGLSAVLEAVGPGTGLGSQLDGGALQGALSGEATSRGVVFESLARAADLHPELVRSVLGAAGVSDHEAKIWALNAAFWSGATFLYVPPGVALEAPVRVVRWVSRGGIAVFPKVVLVADEGSSVTYVEQYGSEQLDAEALAVCGVEIYAHQAANVSYLCMQDWTHQVRHFGVQRAVVGRDATVRSLQATLGGGFARSVTQSVLDGRGAHAEMLGVYFGDHDQFIDNRTLQLHRAPDTSSELYYKGALKGTSRAIYSGLVDIEKDAKRADAQQANRNLLLSQGASALPDPFLEIKTSEVVRATHGVSVGRPSDEVMFYLQTRGLDRAEAERLYVTGFFQEIIDRVRVPEIRQALEAAVEAELALEG